MAIGQSSPLSASTINEHRSDRNERDEPNRPPRSMNKFFCAWLAPSFLFLVSQLVGYLCRAIPTATWDCYRCPSYTWAATLVRSVCHTAFVVFRRQRGRVIFMIRIRRLQVSQASVSNICHNFYSLLRIMWPTKTGAAGYISGLARPSLKRSIKICCMAPDIDGS